MMKRLFGLLAVCVLIGMGAGAVDAKPLGKIFRQAGLSPADIEMMTTAEKSLYETSSPRVGHVVSWQNPDTGSKGSVKLAALRGGCAYIQHIVYPKGGSNAREFRPKVCRNSAGKWVLAP